MGMDNSFNQGKDDSFRGMMSGGMDRSMMSNMDDMFRGDVAFFSSQANQGFGGGTGFGRDRFSQQLPALQSSQLGQNMNLGQYGGGGGGRGGGGGGDASRSDQAFLQSLGQGNNFSSGSNPSGGGSGGGGGGGGRGFGNPAFDDIAQLFGMQPGSLPRGNRGGNNDGKGDKFA